MSSGHASKRDLRDLINILKPQHIVPAHGGRGDEALSPISAIEKGISLEKPSIS